MTEAVEIGTERWRAEVAHYLPLIARVIVQTVQHRHYPDGQEPLGLPSSAPLPRRHAAVRDGNLWSLASSAARRVVPLISYLEREGRGLRLKAVPVATENRIWAGQMPRWAILISG